MPTRAPLICVLALSACQSHVPPRYTGVVTGDLVPIVYGYGALYKTEFHVSTQQRDELAALFLSPTPDTPRGERLRIAQAVARMEQIAGEQTPTVHDKSCDSNWITEPGRMDCIDEAINTDSYLRYFHRQGWLRFHQVGPRIFRNLYLTGPHHAAQVIQADTGRRYAVDSWYGDNGQEPFIQNYDDWYLKKPRHADVE